MGPFRGTQGVQEGPGRTSEDPEEPKGARSWIEFADSGERVDLQEATAAVIKHVHVFSAVECLIYIPNGLNLLKEAAA